MRCVELINQSGGADFETSLGLFANAAEAEAAAEQQGLTSYIIEPVTIDHDGTLERMAGWMAYSDALSYERVKP